MLNYIQAIPTTNETVIDVDTDAVMVIVVELAVPEIRYNRWGVLLKLTTFCIIYRP
jgi:hypothetical protein